MTKLSPKQASFLQDVIGQWKTEGLLRKTQAGLLTNAIEVLLFDSRRLAKHSFWVQICR
jgi:hypothetical protein